MVLLLAFAKNDRMFSSVPLNQSALPNTAYFIYHICTSSICMLTSGQFNYMEGHCQGIHVKHYPPSRKTVHVILCFSLPPQIFNCLSFFFIQTLKAKTLAACEMIGCFQNPPAKVHDVRFHDPCAWACACFSLPGPGSWFFHPSLHHLQTWVQLEGFKLENLVVLFKKMCSQCIRITFHIIFCIILCIIFCI